MAGICEGGTHHEKNSHQQIWQDRRNVLRALLEAPRTDFEITVINDLAPAETQPCCLSWIRPIRLASR